MSSHRAPAAPHREPTAGFYDDPDSDWADDEGWPDPPPSRILWGRIAVLAAALLLAFVVGRATAGDDSAAALAESRQEVTELRAQLEQSQAEVEALRAGQAEAQAQAEDTGAGTDAAGDEAGDGDAAGDAAAAEDGDAAAAEDGDEAGDEAAAEDGDAAGDAAAAEDGDAAAAGEDTGAGDEVAVEGESYTVEAGDYLASLALEFYDDADAWRVIAEANDLAPGTVLQPGDTLVIPDPAE